MRGYLALSLLLTAACTQGGTEEEPSVAAIEPAAPYVVEMHQADFVYAMPSEIPSGWITFRAPNHGEEHHVAVFLKLPEGVTRADWSEAMADPETARSSDWWGALEDAGGTGAVAPGGTAETIIKMEPGLYGVLCGVIAADGTSHWAHGMHTTFEVTGEQSGAPEPVADIRLTLGEDGLEQEGVVVTGRQVVAVHFADQPDGATHDLHVARLEDGQTLEAVIQLMDRPIEPFPMNFVGGVEQAPEGRTDYFVVEFEAGRYAWTCHLNASNGMAHEFLVE